MKELIQQVLTSDVVYNVAVPIVLSILNWMKNGYDLSKKNKGMGYWKIKYKKGYSFVDIVMNIYRNLIFLLVIVMILRIYLVSLLGKMLAYIITGLLYIILLTVVAYCVFKNPKVKIELWNNGLIKKKLLVVLFILYIIVFFQEFLHGWMELLWSITLIGWIVLVFKNSDMIFILDKSYADIYVNRDVVAKGVIAGSMRRQGDWVFVDREVGGSFEEIRIREEEITRIDYYGNPAISIEPYFKKRSYRKNTEE